MPDLQFDHEYALRYQESLVQAQAYYQNVALGIAIDGTVAGVSGSTARAYRGYQRPLNCFNDWAQQFRQNLIDNLAISPFDEVHAYALENLRVWWQGHQAVDLPVPYVQKLVDLHFKWLARDAGVPELIRTDLVANANIPLDKWSLRALSRIAPGSVLNPEPRMGIISSVTAYNFIQECFREVTQNLEGSPLLFDYFAWHMHD